MSSGLLTSPITLANLPEIIIALLVSYCGGYWLYIMIVGMILIYFGIHRKLKQRNQNNIAFKDNNTGLNEQIISLIISIIGGVITAVICKWLGL